MVLPSLPMRRSHKPLHLRVLRSRNRPASSSHDFKLRQVLTGFNLAISGVFRRRSAFELAWGGAAQAITPSDDRSELYLLEVRWSSPANLVLLDTDVVLDGCVINEPLTITTGQSLYRSFDGRVTAMKNCTVLAPVTIAAHVSMGDTSFEGSTGLDQLRFNGRQQWRRTVNGRQVLADERRLRHHPWVLEQTYRQLRAGLEASNAAPAAADFYYGELEPARHAAPRISLDRYLLPTYKWLGGYGVHAWRPFAWYVAVVMATAWLFRYRTRWFVRKFSIFPLTDSTSGSSGIQWRSSPGVRSVCSARHGGPHRRRNLAPDRRAVRSD